MIMDNNVDAEFISIGELSRLTGITTHTLRMWEKRYGTPKAQRLPSGHRRYPKTDVPRLRAIAKALDSGYRASKVVTGTLEQLHTLMGLEPFTDSLVSSNNHQESQLLQKDSLIETWINYCLSCNDDDLLNAFHLEWGNQGGLRFMLDYVVPFLNRVGKAWEEGVLKVPHEHFATECLIGFISEKWRQLNVRKSGPCVIVTTLPGESYTLGVLMCSVITSLSKVKIIYLGSNTPLNEIINFSKDEKPCVLALSISHVMSIEFSEDCLFKLRGALSKDILIVTGGQGSPCNIPGVTHLPNFEEYHEFLESIQS